LILPQLVQQTSVSIGHSSTTSSQWGFKPAVLSRATVHSLDDGFVEFAEALNFVYYKYWATNLERRRMLLRTGVKVLGVAVEPSPPRGARFALLSEEIRTRDGVEVAGFRLPALHKHNNTRSNNEQKPEFRAPAHRAKELFPG
jgi:hypothetical protein